MTAEDGQQAVDLVTRSMHSAGGRVPQVDVVLMDYHMPNMDGPTACQRLRDLGYRGLIIGLTGDIEQELVDEFLSRGADYVLTKPLDTKALDGIIRTDFQHTDHGST